MTTAEALAILRQHNAWRRGDEGIEQADPHAIGEAIDVAVTVLAQLVDAERSDV
jgi:hypothetical protein